VPGSHLKRTFLIFFIRNNKGLLGLGTSGDNSFVTKVGDELLVLKNGRDPFILRAVGKGYEFEGMGSHIRIGDCYVYGAMTREFDVLVINYLNKSSGLVKRSAVKI
jgi:hypothetical protein